MRISVLLLLLLAGCSASNLCNPTTYEVRGTSLTPRIEPGDTVVVETNKSCYNITRDDLVIYSYAGHDAPIIKAVKAVPGDEWRLDGCNIIINNQTLTNDEGKPYCVPTRRLALYTHDYPILEEDMYLLLGEQPEGTLDGSIFGLASEKDIKGKVVEVVS